MLPEIRDYIDILLKDKYFRSGLVIGCNTYGYEGNEYQYDLLKKYTGNLCCIDIKSIPRDLYKCGYEIDIRYFMPDYFYDVIFMFDVVEHIEYQYGIELMKKLYDYYPSIYVTTPLRYFPIPLDHVSVYTTEELEQIGYKTNIISLGIADIIYGGEIVAYK